MATVKVKAKVDGLHATSGQRLTAGVECVIEEDHFHENVFERPSPDWLAPWEQKEKEAAEKAATMGEGPEPPEGVKVGEGPELPAEVKIGEGGEG